MLVIISLTLKYFQYLIFTQKGIVWKAQKYHIHCINHIINIDVQKFLKICKVLNKSAEFENEDLNINDYDTEEATMNELNERDAAVQI